MKIPSSSKKLKILLLAGSIPTDVRDLHHRRCEKRDGTLPADVTYGPLVRGAPLARMGTLVSGAVGKTAEIGV
jgi:hypothetical protein